MTTAGIFLLPNGTFFIELIVSILLILAIYKWVLPPINKALEDRQEKIRTSLEAADQARSDAEAADDERRAVLEQARQQAREIVATANRTAEQVRTDAQARGQSEYDRVVGNADVEIALARQRAVEEAASRMGEIVMEVVERVIGREVNAEAHRDLIDEAVAALRADTVGWRGRRTGRASEPHASGLHGGGHRSGRLGRARSGRGGPRSDRTARHVQHAAAGRAQRHRRPGPGTPGRDAGPARGQGGARGAPPGRLRVRGGPRPGNGVGPGLAGHPGAPPVRGRRTRSRRSACWRPANGWRVSPTALYEDMSTGQLESLEDDLFRFARVVEATPALRGAFTDRDLAPEARVGVVTQLLSGKVADTTLAPGPLHRRGRPGPRLRGHARPLGRADGAGPRVAHCPSTGSRPDRRRPAHRADRFPGRAGRRARWSCRWRWTSRCSAVHSSASATSR